MIKYLLTIIIILLSTQLYSQTKTLKILLDDGTTGYYPVGDITNLTFEDDACDGVRTLTYEGKLYSTVQIGSQCWMQQNLDVGTRVDKSIEQIDNNIIEKYCYNDLDKFCHIYGGLYQWGEAMQYDITAGTKGICPVGWHIPTRTEYSTLKTEVNDDGKTLLAIGEGNGVIGSNTRGFSALLGGIRYSPDSFVFFQSGAWFWNSTHQNDPSLPEHIILGQGNSDVTFNRSPINYGLSIRCIKD